MREFEMCGVLPGGRVKSGGRIRVADLGQAIDLARAKLSNCEKIELWDGAKRVWWELRAGRECGELSPVGGSGNSRTSRPRSHNSIGRPSRRDSAAEIASASLAQSSSRPSRIRPLTRK
jgi:hypothetical protein